MRSGVSSPSFSTLAAYTPVNSGQWSVSPAGVLSDLRYPRYQAVASTAGAAIDFTFSLPSKQTLNFLSLVHHNGIAGCQVRAWLFTDNNPDPTANPGGVLYDSGLVDVWGGTGAPNANFPAVFPLITPASYLVRSGRIRLNGRSGLDGTPWQLGGVELGRFYSWPDVRLDRELGVAASGQSLRVAPNIDHGSAQWAPRTVRGSRGLIDKSELEGAALDFQVEKRRSVPFVWIWDYDDPTTWATQCMLVRNDTLPAASIGLADAGGFPFEFKEHLG